MILKKHPYIQYALVAQSEERATVNREVGGSKPPEGVTRVPELVKWAGLKIPCFGFVGSNPTSCILFHILCSSMVERPPISGERVSSSMMGRGHTDSRVGQMDGS